MNKTNVLLLIVLTASLASAEPKGASIEDYGWWREARFGIFIHWNMSSLLELGGGSWYRGGSDHSLGGNKTTN
ncbi:MAG: alpha-L-fucosidase, partial [Kiritimatiellaceae bacterium]|nr:alpha-L-fucosidase [Kiritimatiellaceae bacterium]